MISCDLQLNLIKRIRHASLKTTTHIQLSTNVGSRRSALLTRTVTPLWSALIFAFFPAECKRDNRALTRGISAQPHLFFGGADRVRTDDPLLAKQVLSQLSYSPGSKGRSRKAEVRSDRGSQRSSFCLLLSALCFVLVGLGRFELPTSRLSGVRSKPTEL